MNIRGSTKLGGIAIAVCALIACHKDKTSIPLSWRNPEFENASFHNLFVIGVAQNENTRRRFEDAFTRALETRGIEAQASWAVLPQSEQLTEEQIRGAIEGNAFDGVLITRLLGVEQEQQYVKGKSYVVPTRHYGYGYYGYYGTSYATVHEPGYFENHTTVRLETNLYSVATGGLVWSGQTNTTDANSFDELIGSMTKAVTRQLQQEKLIP